MDDRERWDRKYAGELGREVAEPDPFVVEAVEGLGLAPGERALDLAGGTGRHALWLAGRGLDVTALDVSPAGLAILEERARAAGVRIRTRAVDLLAPGALDDVPPFDLVVCVLFLHRGLLRESARLVAPGGHLVFVSVTTDWPGDRPPARFRLEPGELARGVPGLEVVRAEETDGRAGLVARRTRNA